MKFKMLLLTMASMMTLVIAHREPDNLVTEDLPCRQVRPEADVDTCYTLYKASDDDSRRLYDRAAQVCRNRHGANGRLAAIPDQTTQQWLDTELNKLNHNNSGQLWIGAKHSGNDWTWHGDDDEPITFTNWADGQPVDETHRCVYIEPHHSTSEETSWKWKNAFCGLKRNFLCEYPDNRCGRQNHRFGNTASNRVAGGETAAEHSWPWMVSIQNSNGHTCGGSLITDLLILTAAHCMDGVVIDRERVVALGMHNLRENTPYTIIARVSNFYPHDGYNATTNTNDIMLLELEEPISFNHGVKPVCLPRVNQTYPKEKTCVATGWGIHNNTSQCCPMWVALRDTEEEVDGRFHVFKRADTLYQCQYSCFDRRTCQGINFYRNRQIGERCVAILSSSSQRYKSVDGVDHYSIRRQCAGCKQIVTIYENQAMISNTAENLVLEVESQYECQLNCSDVDACYGFNYQDLAHLELPSRCELLLRSNFTYANPTGDMIESIGTNYYEITDFFLQDYDFDLRQVRLPVVPQHKCRTLYPNKFDDSMMCAGRERGGADTCKGDSGGPLVCQESDGRWMVHGVVSWGEMECGLGTRPGVYAMVAPHRKWIDSIKARVNKARLSTNTPGPIVETTYEGYDCDDINKNPCTPDNIDEGWRCFSSTDRNPNKFIFCTKRGKCLTKDACAVMNFDLEENTCYFAVRMQHSIAESEPGALGFRIKIM